jgi:hypothetical protein
LGWWARDLVQDELAGALALVAIALCTGLAMHVLAVWLRDSGPAWDGMSLKGNGALIVLPVAVVALVVVEVEAARRRSWLGMLLVPVALFAGLFVVAGGI